MSRLKKLLGVVGVVLVLFTGCSKNENIEGKVEDIFGNALPEVTVKIEKSTFTAKTDDSGLYSLDYAPSSMRLIFSKDGYTTMSLSLDIKQRAHYPAETVILYPIPKEEGMFYIDTDNKRLIKLEENGKIEESVFRESYMNHYQYNIKNLKSSTTYIKSGKAIFIDRTPYPVKLTSFKENGLFYRDIFLSNNSYFGLIKDTGSKIGAEKLIVRTIKLTPGDYAWVQMSKSIFAKGAPKEDGIVFGFKVEGGSTTKKTDSLSRSQKEQREVGLDPKPVGKKDSINLNSNFLSEQKDQQPTQPPRQASNQLTNAERQELEQLKAWKAKATREKQANSEPISQSQTSNSRSFQNTRVDTRTDGSKTYYARISQRDHYGKSGQKLKGAGIILQQDRANYHKYHKRDREDTDDGFFDTRDNRDKIKRMLTRGSTSQKTLDAIRYGTPLVKVKIYNDSIDVTLKSGAPQIRKSKGKASRCNTIGYIRGISRQGDGFVAVRKGSGTGYRMIDKIYHNGEKVKICDRKGKWKGIIYGDCLADSSRSVSGSCKAGWVYGQYIRTK